MQPKPIDRIILGHNQFFGVNHLSSARAAERARQFVDNEQVLDLIRCAWRNGAGGLMMSTHERAGSFVERIREQADLRAELRLYPLLPYTQKYVTRANEVGMLNVIIENLSGTSFSQKAGMIWQSGRAMIGRDVNSVLAALMRVELKVFRGLDVAAVFLHDAFTDLALAFGLRDVFEFYVDEIERTHGARAAFATKNLPTFLARFKEWGLPRPLVMTHVNKVGFHMNPSRQACEQAISEYEVEVLAMGSLASGYLQPEEAYSYLGSLPNMAGVVVGASSRAHIQETFAAVRQHVGTS